MVLIRWGPHVDPKDAPAKCIFLTTCLPWFFSQMRIIPLRTSDIIAWPARAKSGPARVGPGLARGSFSASYEN